MVFSIDRPSIRFMCISSDRGAVFGYIGQDGNGS